MATLAHDNRSLLYCDRKLSIGCCDADPDPDPMPCPTDCSECATAYALLVNGLIVGLPNADHDCAPCVVNATVTGFLQNPSGTHPDDCYWELDDQYDVCIDDSDPFGVERCTVRDFLTDIDCITFGQDRWAVDMLVQISGGSTGLLVRYEQIVTTVTPCPVGSYAYVSHSTPGANNEHQLIAPGLLVIA